MRLLHISLSFMLAVTVPAHAAELDLDFNNGIPPEIKLYDLDGNTPSTDLGFTGLKPGMAWVACDVDKSGKRVAVSTSWYTPAGTSDDWMVLPAIEVHEDTELWWTARAFDAMLPDGYSVYVSEYGDTPEDFDRTNPFFRIGAESAKWTDHRLSLSDYAGKKINVAFVNDSRDRNLLLLERISISASETLGITFSGERSIVETGSTVSMEFTVTSGLATEQTLQGAGCNVGGKEYSLTLSEILKPNGTISLEFPDAEFTATKNLLEPIDVWVYSDKGRIEKRFYAGHINRTMVVEEATGTWCGYCVSGMMVLERIKEKYAERAICIAAHDGDDPMAIEGYTVKGTGNPRVTLNREGPHMHPLELEEAFANAVDAVPDVALDGTWSVENSKINVKAGMIAGTNNPQILYRLAFVVMENDVHHPDGRGYSQKNYYSGGNKGPMGGFENLPDPIPAEDMWYQDVARGIYPSHQGLPNAFGTTPDIGERMECSYTFPIPDNVDDVDNIEVAVLAIDARTAIILNGCIAIRDGLSDINTIPDENISFAKKIDEVWFDISGSRVTAHEKGIYILQTLYSDGTCKTVKVAL